MEGNVCVTRVTIRIYEDGVGKGGWTDGPRYFYELRRSFSLAFPPYKEFALSPFYSVKQSHVPENPRTKPARTKITGLYLSTYFYCGCLRWSTETLSRISLDYREIVKFSAISFKNEKRLLVLELTTSSLRNARENDKSYKINFFA